MVLAVVPVVVVLVVSVTKEHCAICWAALCTNVCGHVGRQPVCRPGPTERTHASYAGSEVQARAGGNVLGVDGADLLFAALQDGGTADCGLACQ